MVNRYAISLPIVEFRQGSTGLKLELSQHLNHAPQKPSEQDTFYPFYHFLEVMFRLESPNHFRLCRRHVICLPKTRVYSETGGCSGSRILFYPLLKLESHLK
jgi:hypothetical protein